MRKTITTALAALTLAGGAVAATDADARDWRRGHGYYDGRYYDGRYYRRHRGDNDDAIIAGIAGLAIGAALASSGSGRSRYYYDDGYYGRGYYGGGYYRPRYDGYGYYGRPRSCRTVTQWDPYWGGYTRRTRCW